MKTLSPACFLAAANSLIAETRTAGQFDGTVEASRASALMVNHAGYHSHLTGHYSNWPFRLTCTCDEMARQADRDGALHETRRPRRGEIYLRWSWRKKRFIGAGIVLEVWERPLLPGGWGYRLRLCVGSARMVDPSDSPYRHSIVDWAMEVQMDTQQGDRWIAWSERRDPAAVVLPFRTTVSAWRKRETKRW
jgi:hypothetical protein